MSFQSLFDKAGKSLPKSIKKGIIAATKGEKLISGPEEKDKRMKICLNCLNYNKISTLCDMCGCFVAIKTKLDYESCPAGKW